MANPINTAPSQERVEVINLDVLDKRLTSDKIEWYCEWVKGGDPERRIRVDQDTPLDSFLESVKRLLKNKSTKDRAAYKIGVLTILAHGYGRCEYKNAKAYAKGSCTIKQVHAGFGIKFCKDDINLQTVEKFKLLNGLFKNEDDIGIKLLSCGAAAEERFHVFPNSADVEQGFGKRLCKRLAAVTGTCVMASEAIQEVDIDPNKRTYRWGADVQTVSSCARFKGLIGQVWIFHPNGTADKVSPDKGT
jgi:hypothetical protein